MKHAVKKTPSRTKKRTDKVTLERVYRKVLALEKALIRADGGEFGAPTLALLRDIGWGARKDVTDLRVEMREKFAALMPIVGHCERLMREKITLQKQVESANQYMAATRNREDWGKMVTLVRPTKCAFTHLHRPGIRCAVCHHMEINYGPP